MSGGIVDQRLVTIASTLLCLVRGGSSRPMSLIGNTAGFPGAFAREQEAKVYITPLPQEFHGWSVEHLWGFRGLGNPADINQSLWAADWHAVDKWWINQLNISPLRTADPEKADFIFIPATIRYLLLHIIKRRHT